MEHIIVLPQNFEPHFKCSVSLAAVFQSHLCNGFENSLF